MKNRLKISTLTIVILLSVILANVSSRSLLVSTADQASSLVGAEKAVGQAFNSVLKAEQAGSNVTGFLTRLNDAYSLIAQAKIVNRTGDTSTIIINSNRAISISYEVIAAAVNARETALVSSRNAFWSIVAFSLIIASTFVSALFLVWRRFMRSYIDNLFDAKPEVNN